jgi:CheY-like chemotaxis protein
MSLPETSRKDYVRAMPHVISLSYTFVKRGAGNLCSSIRGIGCLLESVLRLGVTALPVKTRDVAGSIRIVIADDHTLFRDGLSKLIEAEPGFEIVGEAVNSQMLIIVAKEAKPDIILLDLAMPLRDGMWALRALSEAGIQARTLLFTASIEKRRLIQALRLGAYGVIPKDTPARKLFEGIRCVMAGQYWVGRDSVSDLRTS